MIKKISAIVLALILCLSVMVVPVSAGAELNGTKVAFALEWDKEYYQPGDTATLYLYLALQDDVELNSGSITLALNSAFISPDDNDPASCVSSCDVFSSFFKDITSNTAKSATAYQTKIETANTDEENATYDWYIKTSHTKNASGDHENCANNLNGLPGSEIDPSEPWITYTFTVSESAEDGATIPAALTSGATKTSPQQIGFKYYSYPGEKSTTAWMTSADYDVSVAIATATVGSGETACEHANTTTTEEVTAEATCTADGSKVVTVTCDDCGEVVSETTEAITATGHAYDAVVTDPTCTAGGYTTYTCSVCGDTYTGAETAAKDHSYDAVVTAPTCTAAGYTTYTCSVCGDTYTGDETDALGHTAVVDAAVAATCTATGLTEGSHCSVCNEVLVAQTVVDALGHTEVVDAAVAATCTATGLTEGSHCSVCNEVLVAQTVVDALGHTVVADAAVNATCTATGLTEGSHCSVCNEVLVAQTVVDALGHSYDAVVTAPTCTAGGYTTYTCSVCGDTYTADETDALGHTVVTDAAVAATCTATGLTEGSHCSVCNEVLVAQTVVDALGHSYDAVVTAPTCTADGYTTYTCSVCGDTYTGDETDALGHTAVVDAAVAATCTATGLTEGSHCSVCNEVLVAQTVVDALGHTEVVDAAVAATCTTTGLTEGKHCSVCNEVLVAQTVVDALGHTEVVDAAVAATCTATGLTEGKHCSVCNEVLVAQTVVDALGHTAGDAVVENSTAATCGQAGSYESVVYCSVCGTELSRDTVTVDTVPHSYDAVVTAPTCTAGGYTTYTCSVCGDTYTGDETDALGHTAVVDAAVAATCTATGLTEGSHCSVCNEVLVAQTVVDSLGHTEVVDAAVAATCTATGLTEGSHCSVCNEVLVAQTVVDALGHSYDSVVTAPTCTADGYTTYTCSVCGDTYTADETDALGHTAVVDAAVAATCTATGLTEGSHCSVCNEVLVAQTVVDALGHTEVVDAAVAATCTATGLTEGSHCSVCNEVLVAQTVVDALGHTAGDAVVENSTAATCGQAGSYESVVYCSVCGTELSRDTVTVDTVPHSYDAVVTDPTCTAGGYTTYTCSVCGDTYTADETDALGHTAVVDAAVAATCTATGLTEGSHCSVCNEVLVAQTVVDALGHTEVVDAAVAATCTATGLTEGSHCSVCNEVLVAQTVVDALGHTETLLPAEGVSCTEDGLTEGWYCSVCDEVLVAQEAIPATGHSYDAVVTAPTCTADGYTTYTCSACGDTYTADETDATGHTAGAAVVENEVAATYGKTGSYESVVYCSACGTELSRDVVTVEKKALVKNIGTQIKFNANDDGSFAGTFDIRVIAGMKKADFLAAFGSEEAAVDMITEIGFVFAAGSNVTAPSMDDVAAIVENGASVDGYAKKTVSYISTGIRSGYYAFTCNVTDITTSDLDNSLVAVGYIAWDSDADGVADSYAYYPTAKTVSFEYMYNTYYPAIAEKNGWDA